MKKGYFTDTNISIQVTILLTLEHRNKYYDSVHYYKTVCTEI